MKHLFLSTILCLFVLFHQASFCSAIIDDDDDDVQEQARPRRRVSTDRLVLLAADGLTATHVDAWGDDSIRVRVTRRTQNVIEIPVVQALLPHPPPTQQSSSSSSTTTTVEPSLRLLVNGNLRVTEHPTGSGLLRFERVSDGTLLLQQKAQSLSEPVPNHRHHHPDIVTTGQGAVTFQGFPTGTAIYGFGEHRGSQRCTNQCTNASLPIYTWDWNISDSIDGTIMLNNGNAWIPFFQTSTGLGFLWNMASYGHVHVGPDAVSFSSTATRQLDYYVTTTSATTAKSAPPYADLMRHYVQATGKPPILPHIYTGFWQCRLRYSSQKQVLDIARQHVVEHGLPMSVIVIDFFHWKHFGDWHFADDPRVPHHNTGCWSNPRQMVKELEEMGVQLAVSVWPMVDAESYHLRPLMRRGLLARGSNGLPKVNRWGKWNVDAFQAEAREYQWQQLVEGYASFGIRVFWLDSTEPADANIGNWYYKLDADGKLHHDAEVGMAWVSEYHRMVHEGMMATYPNSSLALTPFLTRSAFAGSQRYGGILWSGDIESTFDELAVQVQTAQHVSMSGVYLWTTDIGGFRNGNSTDPVFRELLVRWFQFGAFCPIFRLHGDRRKGPIEVDYGYHTCFNESSSCVCGKSGYNEVWKFGDEAYEVISKLMWLREDLRDYVSHHLRLSHEDGIPILRPMVYDFPDKDCMHATDQFMFGDSWLVSPVIWQGSTAQKVYLPKLPTGQQWMHYYRNQAVPDKTWPDGSWVTVPTPALGSFPLFVRVFHSVPGGRFDFSGWYNGNHPDPISTEQSVKGNIEAVKTF